MSEWQSLLPDGESLAARQLRGLSLAGADRVIAERLTEQGVITVRELRDGLSIETHSHVGWIALGPIHVTITPKIGWSHWLPLIAFGLRLGRSERTRSLEVSLDDIALHDLLVLELARQASQLIAHGLHREYVRHRGDLASPRGHMDFSRITKRGGIREAAIPCRFTRRSENSVLNQALLASLGYGAELSMVREVRIEAKRIARMLRPFVDNCTISRELLARAERTRDRRTDRYAPLLRIARLLLDGSSLTLDDEPDASRVTIPGFALDMNFVWQEIVGRVLAEWLDEYTVEHEYGLRGLFQKSATHPYRRMLPTPRPDFAVFRGGTLVAYLDAKYRDLWSLSLPREMLYQLSLYSMAQSGRTATMLYPAESKDAREQRLVIHEPHSGGWLGGVAMRPVRLDKLEELVSANASSETTSKRAIFARALLG